MNSLASFVAFSTAMAFQFSAGIVLFYLLLHKVERHRFPRLAAFFIVTLVAHKAVHDGKFTETWELFGLALGWAVGIYSLLALVLRILRAHYLADKIHKRGEPLCIDCPLLKDITIGGEETPHGPLPHVHFFGRTFNIL